MADEPSNAELGRGQARHEKDIERLEEEVGKLKDLVYTLERRIVLSIAMPVIALVVTIAMAVMKVAP